MSLEIRSSPDKDALAEEVSTAVRRALIEAQEKRGRASLALTGGTMGIRTVAALAASSRFPDTSPDWDRVDIWWSDERFLPAQDADRNVTQAMEALNEACPELTFPAENIHVMGSADDFSTPHEAAHDYLEELGAAAADQGGADGLPPFDVALLGVGPDGHVASMFPGHPELSLEAATVVGVEDSPKPPPLRVSMTLPLISRADHVWFVVAGADKAEAVDRLLSGTTVQETPASAVHGTVSTVLFATPDALGDHAA